MACLSDDHKLVMVNDMRDQSGILDRSGNNAEVHRILEHLLNDPGPFPAPYIHAHIRELALERGKDLGKNVQTGGLISCDHQFTARFTVEFRDRFHNVALAFQYMLGVNLKYLACGCDPDLAAGAVEELCPDLFFKRADLQRY